MPRAYPPYAYGHRQLSETLSELAKTDPERLYASAPKSNNLADGFVDLSFADMDRMSDVLAGWIQDNWRNSTTTETIAYFGVPDLRAPAVFFAAVRSGYKLFLPSPRNAPEVNVALLRQTSCSKIIHAPELKPLIDGLSKAIGASAISIDPFLDLLAAPPRVAERAKREFQDVVNDAVLILHSSGSTGLPKPITMTNGTFAVLDSERLLPTVEGRSKRDFSIWDFEGGGKFFTIFPYFHLAGFLSLVVNPVFTEASTPLIGPPLATPSGALMKEILELQRAKALYIPPSIAEQTLQEPDGLECFKDVDFICYTGGPFSPDAGKKLVQVTDLVPLYGSTEAFQVPQLIPSKEDWAYMEWNPHFKHEMQESEDGAHEMVLHTDASTEKRSALNHNVPGTTVWHTRDLFMRHPSKPSLWRYYGRRDDIIAFSNGEKFNPVPTELTVGSSELLSGALVVGQGRYQAALLLEPRPDNKLDGDAIKERVWPLVERANAAAPAFGQITKSKMLIIPPAAFARAGKGTVIRRMSEQKLKTDIDKLFSKKAQIVVLDPPFDRPAIHVFIAKVVGDAFTMDIGKGDDLFSVGLDSLKSAEIIRSFKASLTPIVNGRDLSWVSLALVYKHPSVDELTDIIHKLLSSGQPPAEEPSNVSQEVTVAVNDYSKELPTPAPYPADRQKRSLTIALTGSTGALGTALLEQLITHHTAMIYCLNRRHAAAHEAKFPSVRFLKTALHEPHLGLPQADYDALASEVDIVIHNAWQVDFALPFAAFAPQLRGVRNLVDLSLRSPRRPRLVFASSVSAAMDWPLANPAAPTIPEAPVSDPRAALQTGYALSKQAAEQIFAAAARDRGADVVLIRFGQLVQAGDFSADKTRMARSWVPALLQTARTVGVFPADVCEVDWLGLDEAAGAFRELAVRGFAGLENAKPEAALRVYNAVNARPCAWPDVLEGLAGVGLAPRKAVTLLEWVGMLEAEVLNHQAGLDEVLPSAQILPFFRALGNGRSGVRYDTAAAYGDSKALAEATPVDTQKVLAWAKMQSSTT